MAVIVSDEIEYWILVAVNDALMSVDFDADDVIGVECDVCGIGKGACAWRGVVIL